MITKRPTMLMILDGYGLNPDFYGNAILHAKSPNIEALCSRYPHIQLQASGLAVGLPEGQMGNSEVGHLNIGGGRIVYQELTRITKAIDEGIFFDNVPLNSAIQHVAESGALHIFGLLSDGGVHSHLDHIKAVLKLAKLRGLRRVYLHCFMDGRDVPPTSGIEYMTDIENFMAAEGIGQVGVVSGRYYAMDRDKRWERLEPAYDALTLGHESLTGTYTDVTVKTALNGCQAVQNAYDRGETDEFILPTVCCSDAAICDGDSVIFCNFRPDRAREITRALVDPDFDGFTRKKIVNDLCYVCMTQYDASMPKVEVAFPPQTIDNTLGEYISSLGLHQLRIAETEKYAHVTFFFNGGVEAASPLEDRILVPSPKVATYDLQPEMSAPQVTEQVLKEIESSKYDVIILNFANADMVGHTGSMEAAIQAIEALDSCVGKIADAVLAAGGQILLTADHGNADTMLEVDGEPITSHSTNPVPLVHIAAQPAAFNRTEGKLADIAPTLLHLMGLPVPPEMTGDVLVD